MQSLPRTLFPIAALCLGFSACTLRPPSPVVTLRLVAPPASLGGFSCYFVNISGPGTVKTFTPDSLDSAQKAECLGLGTMSPLLTTEEIVTRGATLSIVAGRSRKIQIFGVMTSSPNGCAGKTYFPDFRNDGSSTAAGATGPTLSLYELGTRTVDLFASGRVPINVSYDTLTKTDLMAACRMSEPPAGTPSLTLSPASVTIPLGGTQTFDPDGGNGTYLFEGSPHIGTLSGVYQRPWKSGIESVTVRDSSGARSSASAITLPAAAVQVGASGSMTHTSDGFLIDSASRFHLFGSTNGDLQTGGASGGVDMFYLRLDSGARQQALHQYGVGGSSQIGPATMAESPGNGIYVTGDTNAAGALVATDFFVSHPIASAGVPVWHNRLDSPTNLVNLGYYPSTKPAPERSLAFDASGNVYVYGTTQQTYAALSILFVDIGTPPVNSGSGSLTSAVFLAKYSPQGTLQWLMEMGASNTATQTIATDFAVDPTGPYVYLTGTTTGTIPGSAAPLRPGKRRRSQRTVTTVFLALIRKSDGGAHSVRQFGSPANSSVHGLVRHAPSGDVYLYGQTGINISSRTMTVGTIPSSGGTDTWVGRFDGTNGAKRWLTEIGGGGGASTTLPAPYGFAVDNAGHAYVTGHTDGSPYSPAQPMNGIQDGFIFQLREDTGAGTGGAFGGVNATVTPSSLSIVPSSNGIAYVYGKTTGGVIAGTTQFGAPGNTDVFLGEAGFPGSVSLRFWGLGAAGATTSDMTTLATRANHNLVVQRPLGGPTHLYFMGVTSSTNLGGSASIIGSPGTSSAFVAKLGVPLASQETLWVTQIGTGSAIVPLMLKLLPDDGLFLYGHLTGSLPSTLQHGPGNGSQDVFLVKVDPATGAQQ